MNPDTIDVSLAGRFSVTLKKTFLALRTRNFRLYFYGQLISNSGNWLTNVALTLLVLKITGSGLAIGILAACQFGPILFLSAWGGALADRSDKRLFLMVTQTLEMAESFGLAILAFMPHPPLYGLYALAAAGGIFLAFDNPLRRSFVSEMVPAADLPNAVVLYSLIVNISRIFGPALAGLLVITLGYGWCFTVDAITYIAVLASLFMMRPSELFRTKIAARAKGEIRAGLRYVRSMPVLWISFVMLAVIGTLAYNFTVTFPLFVTDSLHRSNVTYTWLYAIFSVGAVISGLTIARRGLVQVKHLIYGSAMLGLAMLLLAATPGVLLAVPIVFLVGMTSILFMTAATTIVQVQTAAAMRGRVLSLQTVLIIGTTPIGGPLMGWVADTLGARAPIWIGGLACLVAAGFGQLAAARFSRERAQT